ncbi:hypothetical protein GGR56DRAFT_640575 [Xylariaceae sp. FL0804]|nr:hypothetical protein GGR56DRAFT_640575 [Xylariaceae sp. FL0804]
MGNDQYCAICGIMVGEIRFEDEDEGAYDENVRPPVFVGPEDVAWANEIRLMGENPNALSSSNVFIASGEYDDFGSYINVDGRGDPNFWSEDDRPGEFAALDWDADHPLLIPFHEACFNLLCKKLGTDKVDRVALYGVMRSRFNPEDNYSLGLDWGEVGDMQEQYFLLTQESEAYCVLPTTNPHLAEYYIHLPKYETRAATGEAAEEPTSSLLTRGDMLGALSTELLLLVMRRLSMRDVMMLRAASPAALQTNLPPSFWKSQLLSDMPWLYDFPALEAGELAAIEWPRVYRDLWIASRKTHETAILGLANRRRIWQLTDQLTDPYLRATKYEQGEDPAPILEGATCTRSRDLVSSGPNLGPTSMLCLVREYEEMLDPEIVLSTHWNREGIWCGVSTRNSVHTRTDRTDRLIGSQWFSATEDDVCFPKNDWLIGIVVTTRVLSGLRGVTGLKFVFAKQRPIQIRDYQGDQRLFQAPNKRVIVGLQGSCSLSDGRLSKLSLLCQPQPAVPAGVQKITSLAKREYSNKYEQYSWFNGLPPPGLDFGEAQTGYWRSDKTDVCPMEALVFGQSFQELSRITAISGDVHFGGFEVHYEDGSTRSIGPRRLAMKTLSIDGRGGEQIACIHVHTNHITECICFVTNRRRQLCIGQPTGNSTRYWPGNLSHHSLPAGIFASWGQRSTPRARLDFIGPLSCSDLGPADPRAVVGDSDSHGYPWEPCAPPEHLSETGAILGQTDPPDGPWNQFGPLEKPGGETVVGWLDCSRPLAHVRATLCHMTHREVLPLVALRFRYYHADDGGGTPQEEQEEASLGPTLYAAPTDRDGRDGRRHWCWCELGGKGKFEDDEKDIPHHRHESWDLSSSSSADGQVGGQHLRALRLWINKGEEGGVDVGRLAALQLVAEDGRESPVWGCGRPGEHTDTLVIATAAAAATVAPTAGAEGPRSPEPAVEALKFYVGTNDRHTTYGDSVVVAVQGLKRTF